MMLPYLGRFENSLELLHLHRPPFQQHDRQPPRSIPLYFCMRYAYLDILISANPRDCRVIIGDMLDKGATAGGAVI